jgi:hypothetical protein
MKVGDLVMGRIKGCVGVVTRPALKPDYLWVCWVNGSLASKSTLEPKSMLYFYNGGEDNGNHLLGG